MSLPSHDTRYFLSSYVRFLPRNDGIAVYHSLLGGLCLVDKKVTDILQWFDKGAVVADLFTKLPNILHRQLEIIVDIFAAKGFLTVISSDEYSIVTQGIAANLAKGVSNGNRLGVVQLVVANKCNYRCTYCFINQGYTDEKQRHRLLPAKSLMSSTLAKSALDAVIKMLLENGKTHVSIQFFGGEPMLNYKTIQYVMLHYGLGEQYGININYSMVTNGSLMPAEMAELFARYHVNIVISIDSILSKSTQRQTANGKEDVAQVLKNVALLRSAGVTVIFNTVLSCETFFDFTPDFVDHAAELGVNEIGVVLDLNSDFYTRHSPEEIVDKLWAFYQRGNEINVAVTGYWQTIFQRMFSFSQLQNYGYKTCSATGCQLSIEPNGDVFACKASSGYFGHINNLSSLVSGEPYMHYAKRAAQNAPDCEGCEIEYFCSGLCLGPVEKKYGTIEAIEKSACHLYRLITTRLITHSGAAILERYSIYLPDHIKEEHYYKSIDAT